MEGEPGLCMQDKGPEKPEDVERSRLVYVEDILKQALHPAQGKQAATEPKVKDFLAGALVDTLKKVEERYLMYGEKLCAVAEDWQLTRIEKLITRLEQRTQAGLAKKQYSFARKCNPSHLHSDALRNCMSSLSRDLDLQGSCLLDELIASDVMSVSDEESIRDKGSRKAQCEELVSSLMGRISEDQFYHVLIPALNRDHPHLADSVLAEVDRLEEEVEQRQCVSCRVRSIVEVKRLATPLLMQGSIDVALHSDLRGRGLSNRSKWTELMSVPDCAIIEAMKTKYPVFYKEFQDQELSTLACCCISTDSASVNGWDRPMDRGEESVGGEEVHPDEDRSLETDTSDTTMGSILNEVDMCLSFEEEDLETAYKMSARPRGICLIISNVVVKGHHQQTWLQEDVKKLTGLFEKLEFIVVTKTNLKSSEMKATLQEYAEFNHTKFDAFVCFIQTYGDKEEICGTDGVFFKISDLTTLLKASACPTLAGKPKIFFINANRGQRLMTGLRTSPSETQPYSRYIADEADFLIGHSTSPGCKRFWHRYAGSDFITSLTTILDNESDRHDLLTCLTMVNHEVSRRNMLHCNTLYKQVPAPIFTLSKKVFLTTDPLWPNTSK